MLNNVKFLTKELVVSFGYSNFNEDRDIVLKETINGIEYTANVKYAPCAVGGFIFKVETFDHKTKYVLIAGSANGSQYASDEELQEAAKTLAMECPIMCIQFDNMPSQDTVEDMMLSYVETVDLEIIQ